MSDEKKDGAVWFLLTDRQRAAILAFTREAPNDEPNGPEEQAIADILALVEQVAPNGSAADSLARAVSHHMGVLCEASADQIRALRLAFNLDAKDGETPLGSPEPLPSGLAAWTTLAREAKERADKATGSGRRGGEDDWYLGEHDGAIWSVTAGKEVGQCDFSDADQAFVIGARSDVPALSDALGAAVKEIERLRPPPPKALADGALHEHEEPLCGRFYGVINVEGEDPEPLFLAPSRKDAELELARRRALPEDSDGKLDEYWQVFSFDIEGLFWNSYEPNPREAPKHSRLWEMQCEIERLQRKLGFAGEAHGIALFEEEKLRAEIGRITAERDAAREMGRQVTKGLEEANHRIGALITAIWGAARKASIANDVQPDGPNAIQFCELIADKIERMRPVVEAAVRKHKAVDASDHERDAAIDALFEATADYIGASTGVSS